MTTIRVKVLDSYVHVLNLMKAGTSEYVDLTGATSVILVLTDVDTNVVAATINCTIVDVPTAEISFLIGAPLTNVAAMYTADFKIISGSSIMTCPTLAQQGLWVY